MVLKTVIGDRNRAQLDVRPGRAGGGQRSRAAGLHCGRGRSLLRRVGVVLLVYCWCHSVICSVFPYNQAWPASGARRTGAHGVPTCPLHGVSMRRRSGMPGRSSVLVSGGGWSALTLSDGQTPPGGSGTTVATVSPVPHLSESVPRDASRTGDWRLTPPPTLRRVAMLLAGTPRAVASRTITTTQTSPLPSRSVSAICNGDRFGGDGGH